MSAAFPDEGRIRELAEQIRVRCAHAQQLKLPGQPATAAGSLQIAQAEEIQRRLREAVSRLQETITDFSLVGLQEKLRFTAQKLSLSFDTQVSQQQATSFFLSCDAFFVEVCCHDNGHIVSVKVVRGRSTSQQEESELLAQLLKDKQLSEFEMHIKCLTELYSRTGAADKGSVWQALMATENVFSSISESSPHNTLSEVIMTNPLGHVMPRRGGGSQMAPEIPLTLINWKYLFLFETQALNDNSISGSKPSFFTRIPMHLTFFVHPYEVLKTPLLSSREKQASVPSGVGVSGRVCIEKSAQVCRLSIDRNLFNRQTASFFQLTTQNSIPLPVTFALEFSSSFPVCASIMERLHKSVYGADKTIQTLTNPHINELVAREKAQRDKNDLIKEKSRLVCLPSQRHYYFLPPELTSTSDPVNGPHCGVLLPKVPFIHPGHMFNIIPLLRKQLVYNTLLSSCLGRSTKNIPPDPTSSEYIFAVSTSPPDQITVAMDTQTDDRVTLEIVISDKHPAQPTVNVKVGSQTSPISKPELTHILKRCLSIPVLLHAALKHPSILGNAAASVIQKYQLELSKFNMEVTATGHPVTEPTTRETPIVIGVKRKWTD